MTRVSADVSVEFELRLEETRRRVDTYLMWEAADIIFGGCSTDSFFYFQHWLIGLGQETFDQVASDPDALSIVPQIQHLATSASWTNDNFPWWETLHAVAGVAYEAHTGDEGALYDRLTLLGQRKAYDPEPRAPERRDLPQLRELFHAANGPAGPS